MTTKEYWTRAELKALTWTSRRQIILEIYSDIFYANGPEFALKIKNTNYLFSVSELMIVNKNKLMVSLQVLLEDPEVSDQVKENFLFHLDVFA